MILPEVHELFNSIKPCTFWFPLMQLAQKKKLCNALQIWNNKGYKSLLFSHNQVLCQFGYLMFLLLQTFLSDISKKNAKKKEFPLIQLICA